MDKFTEWLAGELKKRNWRQVDLVRAANLDSAVVSNLVNGKRGPGEDTCRAIARAFGYPPEEVYRAAGLLPPVSEADAWKERILHLAEQFPEEEHDDLIAYIEMRIRLAEERKKSGAAGRSKPVTG